MTSSPVEEVGTTQGTGDVCVPGRSPPERVGIRLERPVDLYTHLSRLRGCPLFPKKAGTLSRSQIFGDALGVLSVSGYTVI